VIPSLWKSILVFPLAACLQSAFYVVSKFSRDDVVTHGYSLVARKHPGAGAGRGPTLSA
jgi:hypothetical protein